MQDNCQNAKWHWGHGVLLSSAGIVSTCLRKDSESASASLNASLVSLERWSVTVPVLKIFIFTIITAYP